VKGHLSKFFTVIAISQDKNDNIGRGSNITRSMARYMYLHLPQVAQKCIIKTEILKRETQKNNPN
jgi:hypothetical protein